MQNLSTPNEYQLESRIYNNLIRNICTFDSEKNMALKFCLSTPKYFLGKACCLFLYILGLPKRFQYPKDQLWYYNY